MRDAARAAGRRRCCSRATRSTRTRRGRPRTRPRPRSGSSTRPPTRRGSPTTFDHLRIECVLEAEPEAELTRRRCASCRPSGERHRGGRAAARARPGGARRARRRRRGRARSSSRASRALAGRMRLRADRARRGRGSGGCAPASTTPPRSSAGARALRGAGREPALHPRRDRGRRRALRLAARARGRRRDGGRRPVAASTPSRCSPRRPTTRSSAAAIVLPDHPRIAPESLGNLFDNTEIEEALLLHVQALSDAERAEIAAQDPAVREMIERAAAADARATCSPCTADEAERRAAAPTPGPPPRARATRTRASPSSSSTASASARAPR